MRTALACVLSGMALAACGNAGEIDTGRVVVCRPAEMAAATLEIGTLELPPGSFDVYLQERPAIGEYGIDIRLDERDTQRLAQLTRERLGTGVEIRLDGELVAAPIVQTPIHDGRLMIAGDFTRATAHGIVARLAEPCDADGANRRGD